MAHRVVLAPEAQADLVELELFVAEWAGDSSATRYIDRIMMFCDGLADFPERGTRRDDLWPGLRTLGFERRVTIGFHISGNEVRIDRVLYGGRDLERVFSKDD